MAWWRVMYGTKGYELMIKYLDRFFDHFEAYQGLERFTIAEVTDYVAWRLENKADPLRLLFELASVRKFWKWLTEDKNLPLTNPVRYGLVQDLQRRYALRNSPKLSGGTLAQVEVPPSDIGTPIRNGNYDTSSWDFGV